MKDFAYYQKLAEREVEGSTKDALEGAKYRSQFLQKTLLVPFRKLHTAVKVFSQWADFRTGNIKRDKIADAAPIQNNKLFVMTFQKTLTCNPRYVVDELIRRGSDIEIVVCGNETLPYEYRNLPNIRTVKRATVAHFVEQASSKVWLDNAMNCEWWPIKKKPGQLYLQTWHGSLGLKRIDPSTQSKRWLYSGNRSSEATDYIFSNSDFETGVYRETYWPNGKILLSGHARNDMFFEESLLEKYRAKVFDFYRLPADTKIALYAPTFRDVPTPEYDIMKIDFEGLKGALEKRFGGDWRIAIRLHPRDKGSASTLVRQYPFMFNAGDYPEMQELMCATDLGITDYSSWICDFTLSRRPGFIYAPDLAHYTEKDRGFYYPLESTPFAVSKNSNELIAQIEAFDQESYESQLESYWERLGSVESGQASRIISDIIESFIGGASLAEIDKRYDDLAAK